MRSFLEKCVGLSPAESMKQAEACDLGGGRVISYRDFRKCFNRLDSERLEHVRDNQTHENNLQAHEDGILQLRLAVRAVLDIVDQPNSADQAGAIELIEAALRGRGLDLNSSVQAKGLQALLDDLRLPSNVAEPITRAWLTVRRSLLQTSTSSSSSTALLGVSRQQSASTETTYKVLLDVLKRALALLRGQLDGFYGTCHAAKIDLKQALDKYTRRADATVREEELAQALVAAGFNEGELDHALRDVLQVLDPHNWDVISAPELIRGYDAFKSRQGTILKALASRLSSRGLTPDELFARAAGSRMGVREGVLRSVASAAACH